MAPGSTVETFATLRLYVDTWRSGGVPFYIRTGKCLPSCPTRASVIRLVGMVLAEQDHECQDGRQGRRGPIRGTPLKGVPRSSRCVQSPRGATGRMTDAMGLVQALHSHPASESPVPSRVPRRNDAPPVPFQPGARSLRVQAWRNAVPHPVAHELRPPERRAGGLLRGRGRVATRSHAFLAALAAGSLTALFLALAVGSGTSATLTGGRADARVTASHRQSRAALLPEGTAKTPPWRVAWVSPSVHLAGLRVFGPERVWVAGSDGRLYSWDGTGWSMQRADDDITALAAVNEQDAWTSSDDGIRHWDGAHWSMSGHDVGVVAIAAPDSSHAWAVDTNGLLAWNGGSWTAWPVPVGTSLRAVGAAKGVHAWAVGSGPNGVGIVVHWNGSTWVQAELPQPLSAVFAVDATHAWAASTDGPVFTWDGTGWRETADLHLGLTAITSDPGGNLWAAAQTGEILALRGGRWVLAYRAPTAVSEIAAYDATHVWAIGFDTVYATVAQESVTPWGNPWP